MPLVVSFLYIFHIHFEVVLAVLVVLQVWFIDDVRRLLSKSQLEHQNKTKT